MAEDISEIATGPLPEIPKSPTKLIRQTLIDVSQDIHGHRHTPLREYVAQIREYALREGEQKPYLGTVLEYTEALANIAEKNKETLASLYQEYPDLNGTEAEYLLYKSLRNLVSEEDARSTVVGILEEAGDDITFSNNDGILALEITERGRELLRTASLFKGNVVGLFVPLDELPFIIVPKGGFNNRVTVHELHHLAWYNMRKLRGQTERSSFDQAQDETLAYILGDEWLDGGQSVHQLVYDQNFTLNGVSGDIIQMTEEFLFYALICQKISPREQFVDDESLVGLMQAGSYEGMYGVLDRDIPQASYTAPRSILNEENVWRLFRLFQLRERISLKEKKELINFYQAFNKLRERKHIDRKALEALFKRTAAKILASDVKASRPDNTRQTVDPLEDMFSYIAWNSFIYYTLGDSLLVSTLSTEAFEDALRHMN